LFRYIATAHPEISQSVRETLDLTPENEARLSQAINEFKAGFAVEAA
jgi:F-type H+-transporting ATPase subunit alpha